MSIKDTADKPAKEVKIEKPVVQTAQAPVKEIIREVIREVPVAPKAKDLPSTSFLRDRNDQIHQKRIRLHQRP